jgi:hypothetical protein
MRMARLPLTRLAAARLGTLSPFHGERERRSAGKRYATALTSISSPMSTGCAIT